MVKGKVNYCEAYSKSIMNQLGYSSWGLRGRKASPFRAGRKSAEIEHERRGVHEATPSSSLTGVQWE